MSCVNNTNPKINEKIGNQKDSLVLIIQKLDNELKNKNILTQEGYNKGTLLISTFQKYIELYPNDTLVQNYLFDMIMYLQGLNLTNDALIKMDDEQKQRHQSINSYLEWLILMQIDKLISKVV